MTKKKQVSSNYDNVIYLFMMYGYGSIVSYHSYRVSLLIYVLVLVSHFIFCYFITDILSSSQAVVANASSCDLDSIHEATPEQIVTWTAGFEAEAKRSKLCSLVVTAELNTSLEEFCQLFVNDGAVYGVEK